MNAVANPPDHPRGTLVSRFHYLPTTDWKCSENGSLWCVNDALRLICLQKRVEKNGEICKKAHAQKEDPEVLYPRIPSARFKQYDIPSKHQTAEVLTIEQEDEHLTHFIMEVIVNDTLLAKSSIPKEAPRLLVTDDISTAVLVLGRGVFICHNVFAGRVMLDIYHVLQKRASSGCADLKALADSCNEAFQHVNPSTPRGGRPYWLGEEDTNLAYHMVDFKNHVFKWTMADIKGYQLTRIKPSDAVIRITDITFILPFQHARLTKNDSVLAQLVVEAMSIPDVRCISPSNDNHFLFNSNPILCGTIAFNLKVLFEDAGVHLANFHLITHSGRLPIHSSTAQGISQATVARNGGADQSSYR